LSSRTCSFVQPTRALLLVFLATLIPLQMGAPRVSRSNVRRQPDEPPDSPRTDSMIGSCFGWASRPSLSSEGYQGAGGSLSWRIGPKILLTEISGNPKARYGLLGQGGNEMAKHWRAHDPNNVPKGFILCHNDVRHTSTTQNGIRGFRRFWADPTSGHWIVCECGWRPDLGIHYALSTKGKRPRRARVSPQA
jgi:hypothetical protein